MGKIAFVFAGQGAQYPSMGRDLYDNIPLAKGIYDGGEKLRAGTIDMCFNGAKEELNLTQNAQPCLFLTDLACAAALVERGVKADMAAGFSLGEIPALCFTGVLSFDEAFKLVTLRGDAMAKCADGHKGGMAAVLRLNSGAVEEVCRQFKNVYPVNYNCPSQTVCAGAEDEMDAFCAAVKAAGGRTVKLAVSGAFHTPFMNEASAALKNYLETADVKAPEIPLYSNKTAMPYCMDKEGIIGLVSQQVINGVRWEQTVRNMAADGADTFIEMGAGKTLCGLISKILPEAKIYNVGDMQSLEATFAALTGGGNVQ